MSILARLYDERILKVFPTRHDTVIFMEACDFYYEDILTKDEVRQLAKELLEMIGD